jgi:predicted ATPase
MELIGRRTLLFTDIEGSTALLQRVGHPRYVELLDQHHRIIRRAIRNHDGQEIQNEGDAFVVLFPTPVSGLNAAIDAQRSLRAGPWPPDASISVRMGLHEGDVGLSDSGHHGLALHEAARIASAAHGGQILLSDVARKAIDAALSTDSDVTLVELGEFSLKDIGSHVPLVQVTHPDLPADFPAPRSTGSSRHNLPAQLTSLIGRTEAAAEVVELIRSHRFVSLLGAGGVGKTRLALQSAANAAPYFPGGVWFVELAALEAGSRIIDEIRRSMRIPDDGLGDRTVIDAIHTSSTLILFDNCEHLLDDVVLAIDTLTRECPELHVLTTSREPIGTVGEYQWRVPSLDVESSIELLTARAQMIAHGRSIGVQHRETLERVCRRLDGIPLAIELVAGRLSTIPIDEIETRLIDQFRLLTTGSRGPLRRHQTLSAALDWSYRLLEPAEQLLMQRLAVFPGSFEVPAAEHVCAGNGLDSLDIADLLESLHAKSLISVDWTRHPARVSRSEIVRQFASTLLAETDDRLTLAQRLAEYFAEMCRAALHGLRGAERSTWLGRIEADRDNLGAALDWMLEHSPDDAVDMLTGLKEWLVICDERSWRRRIRVVSERSDLPPRAVAVSNALRAVLAGGYGYETAAEAGDAAERALRHLDAVVDPTDRVRVLTNLALGSREADPESASTLTDQAIAEATRLGDESETLASLLELLIVHHEHHPVTQHLRSVLLDLMERGDNEVPSVYPLVDGALAGHQVGAHDEAIAQLTKAEQLLPPVSLTGGIMTEDTQMWTAWSVLIRAEVGDTETAILLAEDALAIFGDSDRLQAKTMLSNYGQALMLSGRDDEAYLAFANAIDHVDAWRYIGFAIGSIGLASIDIDRGRPEDAVDRLRPIAAENRRLWVRARAHDVLARAALALGQPLDARSHLDAADEIRLAHGFVIPPALRPPTDELRRALDDSAPLRSGQFRNSATVRTGER